jgi:hypothetical protein
MQFKTRPFLIQGLLAACSIACLMPAANGAEIATDPGDYTALPPGAQLGILYLQHTERDAYYAAGNRMPGPFRLDTDIGLARYVRYAKAGEYVVSPQLIVPFGRVALKTPFGPLGPIADSSIGDPIVGSALWLVNQPGNWLAASAFVSVPVGSYDGSRGPVNVGENRWKGIFQVAYVKAVSQQWMLDLVGETAIYGDNDDFLGVRREQRASYSAQAHLRYMVTQATSLSASYFHDFGGATVVGGAEQHDRLNNGRWQLGLASFVTPSLQLQLQAGKGGKMDYGARESSRVNLRLLQVF